MLQYLKSLDLIMHLNFYLLLFKISFVTGVSFMKPHVLIQHIKLVYLKENTRPLLEILSCQFPKFYWPDALQLACYLINRMPSSVRANKILYSIMHPNKPMPNVKPKVFGCTCFVYLHTGQKDKLSAKSIRCIFVGYSRTQKGHCFFSPSMKKRFVTSDVTCFESCPYYPLQNKFVDESPVLNT